LIRRIRGRLDGILAESILVDVGGICYEVYLPPHVHEAFAERALGTEVELCTYHYMTTEPNRSVPVLLGFENELQREFFELLTDVPRLGPRGALRAMALPVATLARAIELQDTRVLKSLPGVGAQRAKDIIATLAGKLGRFVDARELEQATKEARPLADFEADALEVLVQLGMNRVDAEQALRAVREAEPDLTAPEALIRRVFQNR
jgi:Holliday junction DNA helicase RuvA